MKRIVLISLLVFLFSSCDFLKNPFAPSEPEPVNDPWKYGGEIEIMYVRVLPVVNPSGPDPSAASIYHSKYGGNTSSSFIRVDENKWMASISLNCDGQPYYIATVDMKVNTIYAHTGEKFFLRLKKEGAQWVELTCIVQSPSIIGGKAAKFVFYNGRIENPSGC